MSDAPKPVTQAEIDAIVSAGVIDPNRLAEIGREIGELCRRKNTKYGSAFAKAGDVMRVLYPDGIQPDQMVDALLVVRVIDKLFRIANDDQSDKDGESPWRDIGGYGVLGAAKDEQRGKT